MENYIMFDGKKFELGAELAELAEMLAQAVKQKAEMRSPFDRQAAGDLYYYIASDGGVVETDEELIEFDSERYDVANYCTDKELMEQRALHETLNRLLWRYSEQHGGDHPWTGIAVEHYLIYWDSLNYKLGVSVAGSCKDLGVVYFKDKATAQKAIEEIVEPFVAAHPDFRW